MTDTAAATLAEYAARWRPAVDAALDRTIGHGEPSALFEAMRYAALGPGKRLRPLLVLAACETAGEAPERALAPATAVELVHAFSLVHDDLPCMDDDDLRRGRPTCHKVFGDAIALLAGDALLARALGYLAEQPEPWAPAAVAELAAAVSGGMVPGQALEISHRTGEVDLEVLHGQKTGRLFVASCRLGALAARCPPATAARLADYGAHLGLAFQIADDILDARSDGQAHTTYTGRYGLDGARTRAQAAIERALAALEPLGAAGEPLGAIARFAIARER